MTSIAAPSFAAKLVTRESLAARVATLDRPLVFTNGVFDVLHRGHVTYLDRARSLGASLVVGINTDASARKLNKGIDRPLNPLEERMAVLAALESLTAVVAFDEQTPLQLVLQCHPDIIVKGGDYDVERLAEKALVRSWGGEAKSLPFVEGYSTSSLVARIRR